jgi:hypothetical protein
MDHNHDWFDPEKLARRQRPPGHNPQLPDLSQDVPDESCFDASLAVTVEYCQSHALLVLQIPLGDADRVGMYLRDMGYKGQPVFGCDRLLVVSYSTQELRNTEMVRLMEDVIVMRVVDRIYNVDHVLVWSVDWAIKIANTLQLRDAPAGRTYRLCTIPNRLAEEMVGQLDDECSRLQVSDMVQFENDPVDANAFSASSTLV